MSSTLEPGWRQITQPVSGRTKLFLSKLNADLCEELKILTRSIYSQRHPSIMRPNYENMSITSGLNFRREEVVKYVNACTGNMFPVR